MRAIERIKSALDNMDDYALMAGIDPLGPRNVLREAIDELEKLRAENEALRKDAERIDFIATEMNRTVHFLAGRWYWSRNPYKTYMRKDDIRKAIDAAMNK